MGQKADFVMLGPPKSRPQKNPWNTAWGVNLTPLKYRRWGQKSPRLCLLIEYDLLRIFKAISVPDMTKDEKFIYRNPKIQKKSRKLLESKISC